MVDVGSLVFSPDVSYTMCLLCYLRLCLSFYLSISLFSPLYLSPLSSLSPLSLPFVCLSHQENVQRWLRLLTRAVDEDVAILPDEDLVFKVVIVP